MTEKQIDLDFNASTPLAPEIVETVGMIVRKVAPDTLMESSTRHRAGFL